MGFSEHMLACLESAGRIFGVHSVWQNDIDDVNFRIVPNRVVILIVVNVLRVHAITQCQLVRLVGMTADQGHHLRLFTFRESGQDLIDRETAQANNCPAQLLSRRIRDLHFCRRALQEGPGKIGCYQTLAHPCDESAASDFFGRRTRHGWDSSCQMGALRGDIL